MTGKKEYWKHTDTDRVYVIESTLFGQIIGSCGPFEVDDLPPLESCQCGQDQMIWIETTMNEGKLRRINPEPLKIPTTMNGNTFSP